jgi:hypothetical protein
MQAGIPPYQIAVFGATRASSGLKVAGPFAARRT